MKTFALSLILATASLAHAGEPVVGKIINRGNHNQWIQSTCAKFNGDKCVGYSLSAVGVADTDRLGGGKMFTAVPAKLAKSLRQMHREDVKASLIEPDAELRPIGLQTDEKLDWALKSETRISDELWETDLPVLLKVPASAISLAEDALINTDIGATIVVDGAIDTAIEAADGARLAEGEISGLIGSMRVAKAVRNLLGKGGDTTISQENFVNLLNILN